MRDDGPGRGAAMRAAAARALAIAALWWVLSGGSAYGPVVAAVSVAGATWASLALVPPGGWRWTVRGFLRFVPYFLVQSVRGGADVARRAFSRGPELRPGFVDFRFALPPGAPRVFMLGTTSLLPGTLSTHLRGDVLRVHVLDVEWLMEARLRELEARVAELYGVRT